MEAAARDGLRIAYVIETHLHADFVSGHLELAARTGASISYGDTMEITFAGTQAETDTERDFFRFLVRAGIPVRVESNR